MDLRICILDRGWVMVGNFKKDGSTGDCTLENAYVIRKWGTTKGLGELAQDGPTKETILEPCNGVVQFAWTNVIATIACSKKGWKEYVS